MTRLVPWRHNSGSHIPSWVQIFIIQTWNHSRCSIKCASMMNNRATYGKRTIVCYMIHDKITMTSANAVYSITQYGCEHAAIDHIALQDTSSRVWFPFSILHACWWVWINEFQSKWAVKGCIWSRYCCMDEQKFWFAVQTTSSWSGVSEL